MYLANMWFQENGDWKLLAYSHPLLSQHQNGTLYSHPDGLGCVTDLAVSNIGSVMHCIPTYTSDLELDGSVTSPLRLLGMDLWHYLVMSIEGSAILLWTWIWMDPWQYLVTSWDQPVSVTLPCHIQWCICDITLWHSWFRGGSLTSLCDIQQWIGDIIFWHPAVDVWHPLKCDITLWPTWVDLWQYLAAYIGRSVTVACNIHGWICDSTMQHTWVDLWQYHATYVGGSVTVPCDIRGWICGSTLQHTWVDLHCLGTYKGGSVVTLPCEILGWICNIILWLGYITASPGDIQEWIFGSTLWCHRGNC